MQQHELISDPGNSDAIVPSSVSVSVSVSPLLFLPTDLTTGCDLTDLSSQESQSMLKAETITNQNPDLQLIIEKPYRRSSLNSTKPMSLINEQFRGISLAEQDEASPTSVLVDDKRTMLPKSISVRCDGYLKTHRIGSSSIDMPQRVQLLGGAEKKKGGEGEAENYLELDVYEQGMIKTELCNKWQKTGNCPYGERCKFAHGLLELRTIIRHTSYKTELCRRVLKGKPCPYRHRCHFRHTVSPHDRLLPHT